MPRQPNWRQDSPLAQLIAIRAGIAGNLSNIADGINVPEATARAQAACDELEQLEPFIARDPMRWTQSWRQVGPDEENLIQSLGLKSRTSGAGLDLQSVADEKPDSGSDELSGMMP